MIKQILEFLLALPDLWEKLIFPIIKRLLFFATHAIPDGLIVWWILYWAAQHPSRLTEPGVFLSLLGQATLYISVYGIFWGVWIYPKIKGLVETIKK